MTNINWRHRAQNATLAVRNFINGQYEDGPSDRPISKHSSRDGAVLYTLGSGDVNTVARAVENAQQTFEQKLWCGLPLSQRQSVLNKLADLIEEHAETFALYESLDVGKPITNALKNDIPRSASTLRKSAEGAGQMLAPSGADGASFAYQLRKPVGVVAGIIGWNFPLRLAASKVGPALAMGNSIVLKPSEFTSLSASYLAALAVEAGVPPGVFNVVHGSGEIVGAALSQHPDVNLLSFTGSSATGKKMMVGAGHSNMKRLILECGGKSPFVVFDDCPDDLDKIAAAVVAKAFPNQGAVCSAGTRLLVHKNLKDQLLPKILQRVASIVPGDPLDTQTSFGALINEAHMNKVLAYIESGEREGAKLIHGGKRVEVVPGGYFVQPTIFDDVNPQQKIAQEEIFGPVLSVLTFTDETEAVAMANDSCFGLAAYAATTDLSRAQRLGQALNAGFVVILGTATPSGGEVDLGMEGHKESGFGYEGGQAGLAAYTVSTAVHLLT